MKTITTLLAIVAFTNASQIYHGTTQGEFQSSDIINQIPQHELQQLNYQGDQSQYQLNQNLQVNNILNRARILNYQSDKSDHGYQYGFETENGIRTQEAGQYQAKGHVVQGAYSYTGDDGQVYTVTYTADENGFHPQGAHLPTPPPTPELILKSLEKNAQDEASGIFDDGTYKENPKQNLNQQFQDQYEISEYQLPPSEFQSAGDQNTNYQPTGSIESYQTGSNVNVAAITDQYQPSEGGQYQQEYQNTAPSGFGHY